MKVLPLMIFAALLLLLGHVGWAIALAVLAILVDD